MSDALQLLLNLDQEAIRATSELRWSPATAVLALVSAWWVKGPLLVAVGWCADLHSRRLFPLVARRGHAELRPRLGAQRRAEGARRPQPPA